MSRCNCNDINPNPNNFKIKKIIRIKNFIIAIIEYHNCKNFEGKKILVYEDCSINEIENAEKLDPHFL